jgi:tetratricopeptide (TPR) repeat protein
MRGTRRARAFGRSIASSAPEPAQPGSPSRATTPASAVVAATAVALIAVALGPHRVGDYYTETDFYGGYGPGARLIQRGVFDASRYGVTGPAFEALLALLGFLIRDLFVAAEVISIASALAALWLWFTLLRERVGGATAAWTTALLAVNATFFRYGYSATTDAMALALQAGALHLALARDRPRRFLAGVCLAVAVMTRYTAIALLPVLLVAPFFAPAAQGRSRARASLLIVAGFAIAALPFLAASLAQRHVPGELLFHNVAYDAFASARGRTLADYQAAEQPALHSLAGAMRSDPAALARREFANLYGHLAGDARDLLGWPVAAVAAFGLVLLVARRRRRLAGPLALSGLALYLALVPAPAAARYSLVLLPFYLGLTGIALAAPGLPLAVPRRWLAPIAGTALVAVSLVACIRAQREEFALLPGETLTIARELRKVPEPDRAVMALKPHVAWLAAARFSPLPQVESLPALAAASRDAGVHYFYMSWIEANNRPAIWFLLDPEVPVPGLTPVASTAHPGAVLYRIEPGLGDQPGWLANDSLVEACAARVLARMPVAAVGRAHLTLAIWWRGKGRFERVREHALAALAAEPRQEYAWRLLGDAQLVAGERDAAIISFERAIAIAPADVDARVALGWIQIGAGNLAAAADAWRPAVDGTTDPRTLQRMITVFRARGEDRVAARAEAAAAKAPRPSPGPAPSATVTAGESAADAVSVIRAYYQAINERRYHDAYRCWASEGASSGKTLESFQAGFERTVSVEVTVGEPGRVDGAAGSRYVEIPVRLTAVETGGMRHEFAGSYTLRRSVVDGATPDQRAWRIYSARIRATR